MSPPSGSGAVSEGFDTALARYLDQSGLVDRAELLRALAEVRTQRAADPNLSLGALLLQRRRVSSADLDTALVSLRGSPVSSAEPAPRQIGPYRVLRVLGVGGMGQVFAVEHTGTRRQEALKIMNRLLPDQCERFRLEAEILASLDHPGLIRIYGADLEAHQPYLTLELCEGGSLKDRLRAGPLPEPELVALAESLASALDYLHGRSVLHRDLKPDNVLFDRDGRPKLTDFGLAQIRGTSGLTATGEILGTPAFMAPEQAGRAHEADLRSDVYGLAATLYTAATGRPPFVGTGLFEILAKVIEDPPTPPRELGIRLSPEFEAGLLRGLAKDPSERPQSAGELAALLRGTTPAPPPRRRAGWPGLLAGVVGLLGAFFLYQSTLPSPSTTPTPTRSMATPLASRAPVGSLLEGLRPAQLWITIAEGRGPLTQADVAVAWSGILLAPPKRSLEAALERRGPAGQALVAYARLSSDRPVDSRSAEVLPWTDLEGRRARAWKRFLARKALARAKFGEASELKRELQELLLRYEDLRLRRPLALPLQRIFVGRFQQTYFHGRRVMEMLSVEFREGPQDLARVLALNPDGLASRDAGFAYYLFAHSLDHPLTGSEGLTSAATASPEVMDQFANRLFRIVAHPDASVARGDAIWMANEANNIGIVTATFAPTAYLSLNLRLRQQAVREGRPALLQIARGALLGAAKSWNQMRPRQLRYNLTQTIFEADAVRARLELVSFDRHRKSLAADRLAAHDQARALLEAQLLLMEGKPQEALELVRGARARDTFRVTETKALSAHALKLLGDPSYALELREFEADLARTQIPKVGLEWYLNDARGVIEGDAWWPGKGPLPPEPR